MPNNSASKLGTRTALALFDLALLAQRRSSSQEWVSPPYIKIAEQTSPIGISLCVTSWGIIDASPLQLTPGAMSMPAFGSTYTDTEIAAVANYVTGRFGSAASKLTAKIKSSVGAEREVFKMLTVRKEDAVLFAEIAAPAHESFGALEIMLSAQDFDAELTEGYGWIQPERDDP